MLQELPSSVVKRIALCLENVEDILLLSSLSKEIEEKLNSEDFWLHYFKKCYFVTEHQRKNLEHLNLSWKQLLHETNRIKNLVIDGIEEQHTGIIQDSLLWLEEKGYDDWNPTLFEIVLNTLSSRKVVVLGKSEVHKHEVTKLGRDCINHGSPEYQIVSKIPDEGISIHELKKQGKKGLDRALELKWLKLSDLVVTKNLVPTTDDIKELLLQVEKNPWNMNLFNREIVQMLRRRNYIQLLVLCKYRVSRGSNWIKPLHGQFSELGIEDAASHKARYYQNYSKYFRENLSLEKCLKDLNTAINKIEQYIGGNELEDTNELCKDAILYNLIVVGEVAGILHNSGEFKDYNWYQYVLLRNNLIHKYYEVDWQMIWNIVIELLGNVRTKFVNK